MFKRLFTIFEMIKIGHSIFAMPFAILAAVLAAGGWFGWGKFALIVACMVFARNVAMTYNRVADAEFDKLNPRTSSRAIPIGKISERWAWYFIVANAAGFIFVTFLFAHFFANIWPLVFSVPVLAYLCFYSHLKQFTSLCHFWLGGAHSMAVIAGFIAINPAAIGLGGIVLAIAVGCWTAGFDLIYSTLDTEFDRSLGLFSLSAKLGVGKTLLTSKMFHLISITGFFTSGLLLGLGWIFGIGVILTGILLTIEHLMVREDDLTRVNLAFFTMNGIISILLAGFGLFDVLKK